MTTLKHHTILYDRDCPLCLWYTNIFAKYGFLDRTGRQPYQNWVEYNLPFVDMNKARNEIALINQQNGHVFYGVDSLVEVLGSKWPLVKWFYQFAIIRLMLKLLYKFISFNRKIFAPSITCKSACVPSKSWFWRTVFIALSLCVVQFGVHYYFTNHLGTFYNPVFWINEMYLFMGQLLFQGVWLLVLREKKGYDYFGHVSFVSAVGAVLLMAGGYLIQILANLPFNTALFGALGFGIIFCWMFLEHKRRVKITGFHPALTYTWVLYRILIYPLVFNVL